MKRRYLAGFKAPIDSYVLGANPVAFPLLDLAADDNHDLAMDKAIDQHSAIRNKEHDRIELIEMRRLRR